MMFKKGDKLINIETQVIIHVTDVRDSKYVELQWTLDGETTTKEYSQGEIVSMLTRHDNILERYDKDHFDDEDLFTV